MRRQIHNHKMKEHTQMHRYFYMTIIGTVLLGAFLGIVQLWFQPMEWDIFIKAMVTLGIIFLITGFLMVVGVDFGSQKNLKDENYLD